MFTTKNRENKVKKLSTKIEFTFEDQEDMPEINVDMKLKTNRKSDTIKIIKNKRKSKDPSTNKLF